MANKTTEQVSIQADRAHATLVRLQKSRLAALRKEYLLPDGRFPAAKNGEWRAQNARNEEYYAKEKKYLSVAKRENQIEAAADKVFKKAKAAQKIASATVTAAVAKTAINKAAAGGDPYAKAWATRIAKYGPTGVAPGKQKK